MTQISGEALDLFFRMLEEKEEELQHLGDNAGMSQLQELWDLYGAQ